VNVTAPTSPTPPAPGDKLDRYDLICPIAEGGMASVWVGRLRGKHGFEKLVAIKTILPRFAGDPRFREMFLDEGRIASRIEHPNVAQIFDLGEQRGLLYLVMEYIDGDSLSKLNRACQKKGDTIPTGVVLRALADACAGLHEAHELSDSEGKPLGIVHRDISPHNVLCSTKGGVKLIDFGIAKTESSGAANSDSGVLKGKIHYMAPEQALGRPVDRRADLWAVGAILYHLLTGKAPYEAGHQLATLHLLGAGLPPAPLAPEVHPAIAAVARKALAHEPSKRYATAAELRDALERAMVVAQLTATSADVSALSAKYLAERAQRRRDAIEHALAAVAGRHRAAGVQAAFDHATTEPRTSRLVSEPPPDATSYRTLGSAALDASPPFSVGAKARRPTLTAIAFVCGFAVVMGASMTLLRPKPPGGAQLASAAGARREIVVAATTTGSPPAAAPSPTGAPSSLPTMAASALPTVDVRAAVLPAFAPGAENHAGASK
jgi:serine/threonine protein kinase